MASIHQESDGDDETRVRGIWVNILGEKGAKDTQRERDKGKAKNKY